MAVAMAFAPFASQAVTYTVVIAGDPGVGSLRDAITQANANCLSDPTPTINFAIPGTGPFTIAPSSPLPILQCGLGAFSPTIDATTQSGYAANTSGTGFNGTFGVILSGSSLSSPGCGLRFNDPSFYGGSMTVRGLDIKNFTYAGGGQAVCGIVQLYGNRITNSNTAVATATGVVVPTIGTAAAADRNVIANNTSAGISTAYGGNVVVTNNLIGNLDGASAPATHQTWGIKAGGATAATTISNNIISGNVEGIALSSDNGAQITGNKIGTDGSGTASLPNLGAGIDLSGASGTQVTGNVISGNADFGIVVSNSTSAKIDSNKIGTNAAGTAALPNLGGIGGSCSIGITVFSNVISGNTGDAIQYFGVDGSGQAAPFPSNILNNKIGVANDGVTAIPNGGNGVLLEVGSSCFIGTGTSSNNVIGGGTIANNGSNGVLIKSGTGNSIPGGITIYANANKNININNTTGPLPNDPGDIDGGPNNQQNYPVISTVTQSGGNTFVTWSLDSTPADGFEIDFFSNPATGTPAGKTWLGNIIVPSGVASGTQTFGGLFDHISMSALDGNTGDSSEFSPIVSVVASPGVTIAPAALSFGNVAVGSTSPSQTSTLTSSGTANYQINTFDTAATCYGAPLCYGGPFTCSTNCATTPTSYAPGNSCTVTASFAPIALGPQTSTIYICDNAAGSPHTITLSGTGVAPPPVQVNPSSQDFGSVPVGGFSNPPVVFNFSNSGSAPVAISPPQTTGPFQVVGTNCGPTIPQSSSCNVNVSFTPSAAGPASGTVSITSGTSTVSASLTGTGTVAPVLVLPSPIDFGGVLIGSSATRTVTLTNSGGGPLTFSSMTVSGPFTLTNNCPTTLQPGQSCPITIGANTTAVGSFSGTLTIVSDGGSGTVPLTVIVQQLPIPLLKITPTTVGFGDRIVGSTSASQRITVLNEGGAAAAITGVNVSPDYVVTGNSCGTNLAPNASCFVDVAMRAIGFGGRVGQLVIGSNATGAPHVVNLAGTGCRPFSATGVRTGPRSNCR
jgi:parallel beta-helix repeat protein